MNATIRYDGSTAPLGWEVVLEAESEAEAAALHTWCTREKGLELVIQVAKSDYTDANVIVRQRLFRLGLDPKEELRAAVGFQAPPHPEPNPLEPESHQTRPVRTDSD